ncbi:MAG: hypothetical protein HQM16_11120 [Deltaproteobacteria bacterium]|nr:hypothetical protein [Deltaproteobacteria bacterium]
MSIGTISMNRLLCTETHPALLAQTFGHLELPERPSLLDRNPVHSPSASARAKQVANFENKELGPWVATCRERLATYYKQAEQDLVFSHFEWHDVDWRSEPVDLRLPDKQTGKRRLVPFSIVPDIPAAEFVKKAGSFDEGLGLTLDLAQLSDSPVLVCTPLAGLVLENGVEFDPVTHKKSAFIMIAHAVTKRASPGQFSYIISAIVYRSPNVSSNNKLQGLNPRIKGGTFVSAREPIAALRGPLTVSLVILQKRLIQDHKPGVDSYITGSGLEIIQEQVRVDPTVFLRDAVDWNQSGMRPK